MKRKSILLSTICFLLALITLTGYKAHKVKRQVTELFKMNKVLQEEGYYMGDFEFQMLGFGYYLDKGQYSKSLGLLDNYHKKLSNKKGLIKIPDFKNNQEEINFYLDLQNPNTGAFIDGSAPYCTYWEISQNIINLMEELKDSTTAPLKLRYPLRFLDEINTPAKLTAFLDDVSYVGWLASRFPQTSFHFARNILSEALPVSTLDRTGFYKFSPEWKHTMLKWMYDFQDTTTGMWGPKSKKNKLRKLDLNNTASILGTYRDTEGINLHEGFPLKCGDKLFKSSLEQLAEPLPDDEDLDEIHEWNLRQSKGIKMLLRYLWKDASVKDKKEAKELISRNIDICFERYYVESDGAFSYYPNAKNASLDGATNLIFRHIGAFSYNKQKKLWGDPIKNAKDMGMKVIEQLKISDLDPLVSMPNINSVRIYKSKPDFKHLAESVWAVFYPKETKVLDIMELVPNLMQWIDSSTLSMGNWTSMAEIKNEYSKLGIQKPLIFRDILPLQELNQKLAATSGLYVVGFDKLQIPRCIIGFKLL